MKMKTKTFRAETIYELTKLVESFKPNKRILSVVYRVNKINCVAIVDYI